MDPEAPIPTPPKPRNGALAVGGTAALVVALLAKSKGLLVALKGLSAGKLLLTF